jgi:ASC-1-like (ASCH) protein
MEACINNLVKKVNQITKWMAEKDEIISDLKQRCEEQQQEILNLMEEVKKGKRQEDVRVSDKKRPVKMHESVKFSIRKSAGKVLLFDEDDIYTLEDMEVFIDGKYRKPSTVYSKKCEFVSYETNDTNQINFITEGQEKKKAAWYEHTQILQKELLESKQDMPRKDVKVRTRNLTIEQLKSEKEAFYKDIGIKFEDTWMGIKQRQAEQKDQARKKLEGMERSQKRQESKQDDWYDFHMEMKAKYGEKKNLNEDNLLENDSKGKD